MKVKDLVKRAVNELNEEQETHAIKIIKNRLKEIRATKIVLNKLEKQYEEMLEKPLDELLLLECPDELF